MSRKQQTRRAEVRKQRYFPAGTFAALLTSIAVTLIGVSLGLESTTILVRALVSAAVLGTVVSIGVGVIRIADAEYKD